LIELENPITVTSLDMIQANENFEKVFLFNIKHALFASIKENPKKGTRPGIL